jgi:hypothetical protein
MPVVRQTNYDRVVAALEPAVVLEAGIFVDLACWCL